MPKRNTSPAVQSVAKERREQRKQAPENELERGLEDTFPASDPVSATHTAVSSTLTSPKETQKGSTHRHVDAFEDKLPIAVRRPASAKAKHGKKSATKRAARALYRTARQMSRTEPAVTARATSFALPDDNGISSKIKQRIRERPIATMLVAVTIGLAWSMRR